MGPFLFPTDMSKILIKNFPKIEFWVHFVISIIAICILSLIVIFIWYPAPLGQLLDIKKILILIFLVTICSGPMLTYLFVRPGANFNSFDFVVVILLQLLIFISSTFVVIQARPVWIVFNIDRFDLVQSKDVDANYINKAVFPFREMSWLGPQWVASVFPKTIGEKNELLIQSSLGGSDLPQRPDLYVDLSTISYLATAKPLNSLINFNSRPDVERALLKFPTADAWLPLVSGKKFAVVLINKNKKIPLGIAILNPW